VGLTHVPGLFLGEAVYAELPAPGTEVERGEPVGLVESPDAVFEVVAPAAGTVTAVNVRAEESPGTITADPFGEGWLFVLRPAGELTAEEFMDAGEYERLAAQE